MMNCEISKHKDNIVDNRSELIRHLNNTDDVYAIYRYIRNAMSYIEEQMRMIDYKKDNIISAYNFMEN